MLQMLVHKKKKKQNYSRVLFYITWAYYQRKTEPVLGDQPPYYKTLFKFHETPTKLTKSQVSISIILPNIYPPRPINSITVLKIIISVSIKTSISSLIWFAMYIISPPVTKTIISSLMPPVEPEVLI